MGFFAWFILMSFFSIAIIWFGPGFLLLPWAISIIYLKSLSLPLPNPMINKSFQTTYISISFLHLQDIEIKLKALSFEFLKAVNYIIQIKV